MSATFDSCRASKSYSIFISGTDPRGTFIPLVVLGGAALIGAVTNTGIYAYSQLVTGGFNGASLAEVGAGLAGAAVSGVCKFTIIVMF